MKVQSSVQTPLRSHFTRREWAIIASNRTPAQVQRLLSGMAYNHERAGQTCRSLRGALEHGTVHCLEAAITAAVILEQYGYPPVVVSLESQDQLDHVLFLFERNGKYGSVARSRDLGLHGRRPVFRRVRDLVMSYYDTYIDKTARITGYAVADLRQLGNYNWRLSPRNVWKVERYLQQLEHRPIYASEDRYLKWRNRYLDFRTRHPDRPVTYYPNRHLWML
ncbi:MAG TPA: hypothetical protein VLZ81_04770 [Blastocatellia bacterium]|nr:hypothetical protein [Blastocatellia bacterium]